MVRKHSFFLGLLQPLIIIIYQVWQMLDISNIQACCFSKVDSSFFEFADILAILVEHGGSQNPSQR